MFKFIHSSDSQGDQEFMVDDLSAYQDLLKPIPYHSGYIRIRILAPEHVMRGKPVKKYKEPLLYAHIAGDEFFKDEPEMLDLLNKKDSFVDKRRR